MVNRAQATVSYLVGTATISHGFGSMESVPARPSVNKVRSGKAAGYALHLPTYLYHLKITSQHRPRLFFSRLLLIYTFNLKQCPMNRHP